MFIKGEIKFIAATNSIEQLHIRLNKCKMKKINNSNSKKKKREEEAANKKKNNSMFQAF